MKQIAPVLPILVILIFVQTLTSTSCFAQANDTTKFKSTLSDTVANTDDSQEIKFKSEKAYKENFNTKPVTGKMLLRSAGLSFGFAGTMLGWLILAPESVSKWNLKENFNAKMMRQKFKEAYTMPPVVDHDLWIINYIGHPYQGGYYFNNMRSQGAGFWPSAMYSMAQSTIWEYGIESFFERPSIQDLIITPIGGALLGEATHRMTLRMNRNGFNTAEKIIVTILNPSYIINHGYKKKR